MKLNNLSNDNLVSCLENCVRGERKITVQVLECISEIDRRRLYVQKGFTSLFVYLVKDFGYSPGAAMRRIDAARLLQEIPEVAERFAAGALTLSQANQVQRASREFRKSTSSKVKTADKRELVSQIENSTQKQTQQIIASTFNLPVVPVQKETLHCDQSVTLKITLTAEQMRILEQAQDMISHAVADRNWAEVITHLAKKEVTRRTVVRRVASTKSRQEVNESRREVKNLEPTVATTLKSASKRPPIQSGVRKTLLHENAACEYRNHKGQRCASKKFLQIDHIQSWSRGGNHAPDNLQVLCGVHNRLKYELEQSSRRTSITDAQN